jgi:SAM-dependent MidA family methyltransferase
MEPARKISLSFAGAFRETAGAGPISFADFMALALYHPGLGYYATARQRVGGPEADFFTASSLGPLFGEGVQAAAASLLAEGEPNDYDLVEIGAEPDRGTFSSPGPFRSLRTLRLGDPIAIPDRAVVFSNELFDAQPFHRVIWNSGSWREAGVILQGEDLAWTFLPEFSPELARASHRLPASAPEGYTLDLPLRAVSLLESILRPKWKGLFIAFDYGRSWRQLTEELPQGSGRAYSHHRISGDLLEKPGERDLTCHICWDWMTEALTSAGFRSATLRSQEAFFLQLVPGWVEQTVRRYPNPLSPERGQLRQLLHPTLMGQKFQALTAWS